MPWLPLSLSLLDTTSDASERGLATWHRFSLTIPVSAQRQEENGSLNADSDSHFPSYFSSYFRPTFLVLFR